MLVKSKSLFFKSQVILEANSKPSKALGNVLRALKFYFQTQIP